MYIQYQRYPVVVQGIPCEDRVCHQRCGRTTTSARKWTFWTLVHWCEQAKRLQVRLTTEEHFSGNFILFGIFLNIWQIYSCSVKLTAITARLFHIRRVSEKVMQRHGRRGVLVYRLDNNDDKYMNARHMCTLFHEVRTDQVSLEPSSHVSSAFAWNTNGFHGNKW